MELIIYYFLLSTNDYRVILALKSYAIITAPSSLIGMYPIIKKNSFVKSSAIVRMNIINNYISTK